jgi:hypothetical protein
MKNVFRRASVMAPVLALLLGASSAKADCGFPQLASKVVALLPVVAQSSDEGLQQGRDRDPDHSGSILGLWHVAYVDSDGTPMFDSFKFWHPDGTEWESASVSPLDGNVCLGVWKQTRIGTIRLHHVGWSFANGVLIGSLTIDEINTVAPNGRTYTGTHTFTFYDLNGNVIRQVKGTHTAKRITVHSTGAP